VLGATSRRMIPLGVPQGFSPPEKLGKFKHTIDLMLYLPRKKKKKKKSIKKNEKKKEGLIEAE
jgi:hypothetical protein